MLRDGDGTFVAHAHCLGPKPGPHQWPLGIHRASCISPAQLAIESDGWLAQLLGRRRVACLGYRRQPQILKIKAEVRAWRNGLDAQLADVAVLIE